MCGPTDAQTQLQTQQTQFYQQMQQQDATEFGEDQAILKQMQSTYAPILAAGPNQFGYSDGEVTNLNTQASEGVAKNFANASKALKEQQAVNGGDTYLPTGTDAAQLEGLDVTAAQEQSQEEQQIQQAGYTQGYDEFKAATSALEGTAGLLNPNGAAEAANTAGADASTTANEIAQENESWMTPLTGALSAVGGAATGAYISKH